MPARLWCLSRLTAVCAASFMVLCGVGQAQNLRLSKAVYLRQTEEVFVPDVYYSFPNLNKVPHYVNKPLRRQINEAENEGDMLNLELYLGEYVKNFGIQNFRQDKDLAYIWKLGQLKEMRRDTTRALYFYSLALKNQSRNVAAIKLQYDSLKAPTTNRYVDLDYYYRIVAARKRIDTLVPPKGVLLNMGPRINSDAPDYAPYMHPSGATLIFTSRRDTWGDIIGPDYVQNEDLYYTQTSIYGTGWEPATKFNDQINSRYNEGSACLDSSGTRLYFTRCNDPKGYGQCDLYSAEFTNGQWTNVTNLGTNVNSDAWDSHPSLSPDGRTLYFASNRKDGFGRTDIWASTLNRKGQWSRARNLGPVVNTIEDEVTPFMHPVNNTLYFSSTGQLQNFGGFDIFKSRNLRNRWEEPRNLGPLVNTRGDEYYFTIDGKGDRLFYASARRDDPRNMDIYSFPLPMNARPDATMKLSGYLIDSVSGQPLQGIVVAIDMEKGVEVPPIYINRFGYFEFQLVANRKYMVLIVGDNNINIKDETPVSVDSIAKIFNRSTEVNRPVVFEKLQFKQGVAEIDDLLRVRLRTLAEFMKKYPRSRLHIHGHTDADGDAAFNLKLSKERAGNIRQFLIKEVGLPDSSVIAYGYGEGRPLYPNDTPKRKSKNRRVEFELVVPEMYRGKLEEMRADATPIEKIKAPTAILTSPASVPPAAVVLPLVRDEEMAEPELEDDEKSDAEDKGTDDFEVDDELDELLGVIVDTTDEDDHAEPEKKETAKPAPAVTPALTKPAEVKPKEEKPEEEEEDDLEVEELPD